MGKGDMTKDDWIELADLVEQHKGKQEDIFDVKGESILKATSWFSKNTVNSFLGAFTDISHATSLLIKLKGWAYDSGVGDLDFPEMATCALCPSWNFNDNWKKQDDIFVVAPTEARARFAAFCKAQAVLIGRGETQ